ncbi:MAG: nucleotidyltransferase domain-containing protein [Bacteroidales bacterium]|nr:nucleotidyltransferase domain-containing protein [Bacteroidales bacterium]
MDQLMINKLREYFKTQPVEKAWVFGSYSRGEERPDSDVDILVTLAPEAHVGLAWFAMI